MIELLKPLESAVYEKVYNRIILPIKDNDVAIKLEIHICWKPCFVIDFQLITERNYFYHRWVYFKNIDELRENYNEKGLIKIINKILNK